jgi:predicted nucleic acid-binding protein
MLPIILARGLNISGLVCLIAAQAIEGGHELFAIDEDFDLLARHSPLRLYRWSAA